MTTENQEGTANSYNGGMMASREGPIALLSMLAEVASQTLHSEKSKDEFISLQKDKNKTETPQRKTHETNYSVAHLLSMSGLQLVKQFSDFHADEYKRHYSYTCALVSGCGKKYTSFASENKARSCMKLHLLEHIDNLKNNKEKFSSFTTVSMKGRKNKSSVSTKKNKLSSRKPEENVNKENKNVIQEEPTNQLRKILLSDSNLKTFGNKKQVERVINCTSISHPENKCTSNADNKVFGDHSYSERVIEEEPSTTQVQSNIENSPVEENFVLMVVGANSIEMKEYSGNPSIISKANIMNFPSTCSSEDSQSAALKSDNSESTIMVKPKGKAKFIGTSKEEQQMALKYIEQIKLNGNPTNDNLQCRICDPPRSFTAPTTLVSHYRSHAGIKPYECRICTAAFTRRHSLKYHMLIHSNQTRFTCTDCHKKFRHPSHFREHRRRHTGEAPYGCDDCGQRFKTRNTYKRHLKTRHGKVLTTNGELLNLSKEDFQKVRTNRKKKTDSECIKQMIEVEFPEYNNLKINKMTDGSSCNDKDWNTTMVEFVNSDSSKDYKVLVNHISKKTDIKTEILKENEIETVHSDLSQNEIEKDMINGTIYDGNVNKSNEENITEAQNNHLTRYILGKEDKKMVEECQTPHLMSESDIQNVKTNNTEQNIYLQTNKVNNVLVQNKCISIIPHQLGVIDFNKLTRDNKPQTISLMQNGKQNTFIILPAESLQNGVFRQID